MNIKIIPIIVLLLAILSSVILAQYGGGDYGQGGTSGFAFDSYGSGVYSDPERGLTQTPDEDSTLATPQQLAANPQSYFGLQEPANQMQREGFTQNRMQSELDIKTDGKNTGQGQWSPDGTYNYHGVEINQETKANKANFGEDGEVNLQSGDGELHLKNNNPSQGSIAPQSGANAPAQPELSSPQAGGGASQAEQSFDQKFQQALSTVQQLVGFLGQLATPFTDSLKSNGEGKTSVTAPNEFGGITTSLENGAAIALTAQGVERIEAMQNNPNQQATIKTKQNNEVDLTNTNFIIPKQIAGSVQDTATLSLGGIDGNSPNHPSLQSSSLATASVQKKSLLTTAAISPPQKINTNQYVTLFDHNLDIKGSHLKLHALKTFDTIDVQGSDVTFYSGDIQIKIEGQKILYPRLVKKAPYGFKTLSSTLDTDDTQFVLQHYENKKGILYEDNYITTSGDIVAQHPTKNLLIAEVRIDMWKKR
ncbi:MAG: hypothetical protein AABX16_01605 [Nanoarchaeota archaeon]